MWTTALFYVCCLGPTTDTEADPQHGAADWCRHARQHHGVPHLAHLPARDVARDTECCAQSLHALSAHVEELLKVLLPFYHANHNDFHYHILFVVGVCGGGGDVCVLIFTRMWFCMLYFFFFLLCVSVCGCVFCVCV